MIRPVVIIILAAVCKAFADTLDHHFDTSVFRNLPAKWFDPNVITKTAPEIFNYPLDAWHLANSLQICLWIALPFVYKPVLKRWYFDFAAAGMIFVVVFNIFYNQIFM